jgi:hypothetical protein
MTESNSTTTRRNNKTADLEVRMGKLESHVEHLINQVTRTNETVSNIAGSMSDFKEQVLKKLGEATAPKWPVIVGVLIQLLTVFGLCGTMIAFSLSGQSEKISDNLFSIAELRANAYDARFEDGKLAAWQEEINHEINTLDVTLQREMTMINAETQAKVDGLYQRLQTEMELMIDTTKQKLATLSDTIGQIRDWKREHIAENSELQGRLQAQVDILLQQFHEFQMYTSSNRWTREDHQHFEDLIMKRIENLEQNLRIFEGLEP